MDRETSLRTIQSYKDYWDVIVIGGGATGLGTAVDAAARGYRTLLLEQHDFAKGTSSRSTKLVHGGVRYLQQGNVGLVIEALHERGLLLQNAPHLVRDRAFIVPNYSWWSGPFYGAGLKVYDMLAGKLGFGKSRRLSAEETLEKLPTLEPEELRGGIIYYDGQFDDARLAVNLAQTVVDQGGVVLNYAKVVDLLKDNGLVQGVKVVDQETGEEYALHARVVINATGVFSDAVRKMDDERVSPIIQASRGVHLVLDRSFLPGDSAIMVPHTDDGRVLFAVPWHNRVIVGTTDTPVDVPTMEPRASEQEIEFILKHAVKYLTKDPSRSDIKSVFAGLRPLVRSQEATETSEISRDHQVLVSDSGLVTITGGKWTTYRKMAEDTIDKAALLAGLEQRDCPTADLRIHGWLRHAENNGSLGLYGSDRVGIEALIERQPDLGEKIHPELPYLKAEVVWTAQNEMARSVEDVLARRTRALLLDARAASEAAEETARLLAKTMHKRRKWQRQQTESFRELAGSYLPD